MSNSNEYIDKMEIPQTSAQESDVVRTLNMLEQLYELSSYNLAISNEIYSILVCGSEVYPTDEDNTKPLVDNIFQKILVKLDQIYSNLDLTNKNLNNINENIRV